MMKNFFGWIFNKSEDEMEVKMMGLTEGPKKGGQNKFSRIIKRPPPPQRIITR